MGEIAIVENEVTVAWFLSVVENLVVVQLKRAPNPDLSGLDRSPDSSGFLNLID